jgi:hypothetical protein
VQERQRGRAHEVSPQGTRREPQTRRCFTQHSPLRQLWFESATVAQSPLLAKRDEFKAEVERELTRRDSEPSELMYFKIYKSHMPVIEQALDTIADVTIITGVCDCSCC